MSEKKLEPITDEYMEPIELDDFEIKNSKVQDLDYNINYELSSDYKYYMWSFTKVNDCTVNIIAEDTIRRKFFIKPKYVTVSAYMDIFKYLLSKDNTFTIQHCDDSNEDDYNSIIFSFNIECENVSEITEKVSIVFSKLNLKLNSIIESINKDIKQLFDNYNCV